VNEADFIRTHARSGYVVPLSDFMKGEGKDVTLPTLDSDIHHVSFTERAPKLGGLVAFHRSPARVARAKTQGQCGPKLNEERDEAYWLGKPGAPEAKANEKPQGITMDCDKLIQAWREGRVK
jgi:glycerol transport system substrate-binding protein